MIKELNSEKVETYNSGQCKKRWQPFSTYKILNSLIALETGVVDRNSVIPWDGKKKFIKDWEKDHSLSSAIKYSVVPFYQEVARRIGLERMKKYVELADYGNKNIGKIVDRFWLDGPIEISAYEQLNFIDRLYQNKLPFKKENQEYVQEIIIQENDKGRIFSGKTGSSFKQGKFVFGWFVGYLKSKGKEYVFVINSEGEGESGGKLKEVARKILIAMGLF
ncbi:MAG: class D beta-lactamase [Halobacteriovoraceae bacterium]|nr:class D beta-lactamase [Halobacteriovoraceae bacterium]